MVTKSFSNGFQKHFDGFFVRKQGRRYIAWMAWRQMTARKRKAGLSFMTVVSIGGVAIGVAALIIVLSVMGGFEQDLKDKMLRGQPHLELLNKHSPIAGYSLKKITLQKIKELFPEALDIQPYTEGDVVLKQKRHLTSAILFGVDADRKEHLWGFGKAMTEGDLGELAKEHPINGAIESSERRPGIALGEGLAEQLSAEIGDEIVVETALGGGTVSRRYVVIGKFRTGLFNYDAKWAVVSLSEGRRFMADFDDSLEADQYVSGIAVNFPKPLEIRTPVKRVFGADVFDLDTPAPVKGAASGARVAKKPEEAASVEVNGIEDLDPLTWDRANKSLLFALKLEKFAMGAIMMLIVVVAGFSISGTMMMTVFHKRGQVSLLRCLGMSQKETARLFLAHGVTIGTVGVLVGLIFGLGVCLLITGFQFVELPKGIYHLRSLPCKWLWFDYGVICVAAWFLSLLASTYPAMIAARQDPGQGLRYL
jgi:lipoprotein-releasing system permease protein